MREINSDKLRISGTFADFMESVKEQLESFISKNKHYCSLSFEIEDCEWSGNDGIKIPAKTLYIRDDSGLSTWFSIAKQNFERIRGNKKCLQGLVQSRFIDCLYSVESIREDYFLILKQFDSDWKTPDCYEC